MKTFLMATPFDAEREAASPSWWFLADSALSNLGKPFYMPESQEEAEARITIAYRISRLGKTISMKYASRYYTHFAPAVHFALPSLYKRLIGEGMPGDPAVSFDRSLFLADWIDKLTVAEDINVSCKKNDETTVSFNIKNDDEAINQSIVNVSVLNTLKTGDVIVPVVSKPVKVRRGDILEVEFSGKKMIRIKIK